MSMNKITEYAAHLRQIGEHEIADALERVEAEHVEALELIGNLMVILKKYPRAATNGCAYAAYLEIQKYIRHITLFNAENGGAGE